MNCYICKSELDSFSKCACCYDELGSKLDAANDRIAALEKRLQAHQTRGNTPTKRME